MASQNQFIKRYQNFYGFDLKSSDLTFPEQYAQSCINFDLNQVGSLVKRKGTAPFAQSGGSLGTFVYNRLNSSGVQVPEILSVADTLKKLKKTEIVVTYTGAAVSASLSLNYNQTSAQYRCQIYVGTSLVLDQALGLGIDEAVPYTCTQLRAAIDALTDITATITGDGSVPAAYCQNVVEQDIKTAAYTLSAGYWSNVQGVVSTQFATAYANRNSVDFEPASAVQLYNVMYFATGSDAIQKYDGVKIYNAGVPTPTNVTSALGASPGITGTNYVHRVQFYQKDAVGNEVYGNLTRISGANLNPVNQKIDVTFNSISSSSGYNTACAIVAGAQTSVNTIVVDNGSGGVHTMKVGDTAYFYDAVSGGYVEREVLSVDTTAPTYSITVAGAAVTVADNAVISANLRVIIYRNRSIGTDPTLWYVVEEIPHNAFAGATQTYTDNTADASLVTELVEPLTDRSPPPIGRYLTGFQNLLIIGSLKDAPNTVAWSDIESPEYFPTPDNQQIIQNIEGDRITAVASSNDVLVVFQRGAVHALSGDLPELNYRVEQITNDVGCVAHQTVRDIRGVIYFLSPLGPRAMTGSDLPQALGLFGDNRLVSRIDPLFVQSAAAPAETVFRLSRAWALHDRSAQKYLLFLPKESVSGGVRYCNSESTLLVYDYARDAWLEWQDINAGAGLVFSDNNVFYHERGLGTGSTQRNILYRRQTTDTGVDYNDHNQAISVFYRSPWDFMGEASVLKNYLVLRVFTTDLVPNNFTLECETELNFTKESPVSQFTVNVGAAGYGNSPYGSFYGDPQNSSAKHKISNGRAKALAMVFKNSEQQKDLVITGYELEVVTPYKPAMKS